MSNIWNILHNEFINDDLGCFGTSVKSLKDIRLAEGKLGVVFSLPYIEFLKKYGSCVMSGHIIYGLVPLEDMGNFITNVVDKTNFYRNQKWQGIDDWYIVSDDGMGNPIGIDPSGKVWLSDHDAGFEKIKLADSFEEFLYKLHTDTLYE